jgi:hypothetical protein
MTTALQKALDGQKISDTQAKGALAQAVDKITNLKNRADKTKEAVGDAAEAVVNTLELQGSVFLASMAEGYFGKDKLKPGGVVDVRAPLALGLVGWGVYDAMSGKTGSASHLISLGNGIGASFLASAGHSAGQAMANKMTPTPDASQPVPTPPANPQIHGDDVREIALTPAPEMAGRHNRREQRRQREERLRREERDVQRAETNRFRRAERAEEAVDDLDV